MRDPPGLLRRDDVADIGLLDLAVDHDLHGGGTDLHVVAAEVRADPFDHTGVVALPAILEQGLLGEVGLGVGDDDLRRRVPLLQDMGDHRDPLIGAGRAAVGVRRRDHDEGTPSRMPST
jgi:hypothetical protein